MDHFNSLVKYRRAVFSKLLKCFHVKTRSWKHSFVGLCIGIVQLTENQKPFDLKKPEAQLLQKENLGIFSTHAEDLFLTMSCQGLLWICFTCLASCCQDRREEQSVTSKEHFIIEWNGPGTMCSPAAACETSNVVLDRLNVIIDRLNVISSGSVHSCLSEVYPTIT
jgi:hypothetical protein